MNTCAKLLDLIFIGLSSWYSRLSLHVCCLTYNRHIQYAYTWYTRHPEKSIISVKEKSQVYRILSDILINYNTGTYIFIYTVLDCFSLYANYVQFGARLFELISFTSLLVSALESVSKIYFPYLKFRRTACWMKEVKISN